MTREEGVGRWVLGGGCWEVGVGSWVLGVGSWELGVGSFKSGVWIRRMKGGGEKILFVFYLRDENKKG